MSIKCPKCSAELPDKFKFCGVCGCKLDTIEVAIEKTPDLPPKTDIAVPVDDKTELLDSSETPTEIQSPTDEKTERIVSSYDKTERLVDSDAPTEIQSPAGEKTELIQPEKVVPVPGNNSPIAPIAAAPVQVNNTGQSIPTIRGIAVPESKLPLKALLAIVPVALVCAAAIITTVILLNSNPEIKTENYLNSAAKYLIEMNYEQAIIAFDKVLEIDPMNVEAYLGKARAYYAMGELDKAMNTLRDGYEKTGDERIWKLLKEYEGELYVEPTYETFKTSFAQLNSAGEGYLMGCGKDELWYFIDQTGEKLSQTGYKFVNGFVGAGDKAYAVTGLPDGRTILINSQFQEILDLSDKSNVLVFNKEDPLVMCWHQGAYNNDADYSHIEIMKPDGTVVYTWKQDEGISGNGTDAKTDSYIPEDLKKAVWSEKLGKNVSPKEIKVDIYAGMITYIPKNDMLYAWYTMESDYGDGYPKFDEIEYLVSYDGTKINFSEDNRLITLADNYTITLKEMAATAIDDIILTNASGSKYSRVYGSFQRDDSKINTFSYELFQNKVVNCVKARKTQKDPYLYALFEPKWYDTPDEAREKGESEWKQISADYDYLGTYDEDTDTLLVQKGDKWGYIDSSGNELAMFDDAASFSGGFAVVTENGRGRVINADFEQIGEDFECESAYSIGKGVFAVKTSDTYEMLIVNS